MWVRLNALAFSCPPFHQECHICTMCPKDTPDAVQPCWFTIRHAGFLFKDRTVVKHRLFGGRWQKRYVVVRDYALYYYKNKPDKEQRGTILLPGYSVAQCKNKDKEFELTVKEGRTYKVCHKVQYEHGHQPRSAPRKYVFDVTYACQRSSPWPWKISERRDQISASPVFRARNLCCGKCNELSYQQVSRLYWIFWRSTNVMSYQNCPWIRHFV